MSGIVVLLFSSENWKLQHLSSPYDSDSYNRFTVEKVDGACSKLEMSLYWVYGNPMGMGIAKLISWEWEWLDGNGRE